MEPVDLLANLVVDITYSALQFHVSSGSLTHCDGASQIALWCYTAYEHTFACELGAYSYRSQACLERRQFQLADERTAR